MGLLSFFGSHNGKIKNALRNGAIIIDVRTGTEYDRGHVPDAFNIPVDRIRASADRLKATNKPVIVCCNSGDRSSTAIQHLKAKGVKKVYNGGDWENLLKIIQSI
ncbi:MAG: rhodanese-like domain-containing protein [Bacteroidota bacterium]|nr:rhodanese-like domain-containing protein [Bacteroidota bacterium]